MPTTEFLKRLLTTKNAAQTIELNTLTIRNRFFLKIKIVISSKQDKIEILPWEGGGEGKGMKNPVC